MAKINFGLKIRQLIKQQKVSIQKASDMMGYSRQGFMDVLEKEDVSTAVLSKVCDVFDIDMAYFLGDNSSQVKQKGNANVAGNGTVQYRGEGNTINADINKLQILENENHHLKKQIELLEQMVDVLRGKT